MGCFLPNFINIQSSVPLKTMHNSIYNGYNDSVTVKSHHVFKGNMLTCNAFTNSQLWLTTSGEYVYNS